MATPAITTHLKALQKAGLALGSPQGGEQDAGYGGRFQAYEHGRIYWHASTGAHELHGRPLERYLASGGHDVNPATGRRELGFPRSDVVATDDGRYDSVTFEWGMITDVGGGTPVRMFGAIYDAWRADGGAFARVGHQILDVAPIAGGQAAWFERGVIWHAEGDREAVVGALVPPMPGQPALLDPEHPGVFEWMRFDFGFAALDANPGLPAALMAHRLSLVPVGGSGWLDLAPAATTVLREGARWLAFTISGGSGAGVVSETVMAREITVPIRGDDASAAGRSNQLVRRQLYSLVFRIPGFASWVVSPHCLYARSDWANFGLAHITDLHVSRRIDHYRAKLRASGVAESDVAQLNNWNDAFRTFIRYANHLHDAGLLDVVIATGDLVDYAREVDDHPAGPGNYAFFEALLQGKAPGRDPESPPSEPLRVPIFTTLGNHDYRPVPYSLGFDLSAHTSDFVREIPFVGGALGSALESVSAAIHSLPGLGIVPTDIVDIVTRFMDTIWSHAGLNTTQEEALRLMGLTHDGQHYGVPRLRPKAAAKAVQIEPTLRNGTHYYFRRLNPLRSYVLRLGVNRVVMLDTRWDAAVTGLTDTVLTKLGYGTESQENFVGSHPDSVGPTPEEIGLLRGALAEAEGVVIVGMHAPPVNPAKTDVSNCLRESVHPTSPEPQVLGWLARKFPAVFTATALAPALIDKIRTMAPGWPRTGTPHFHEGPIEDLLDEGISVGHQEALAKLIAGASGTRPATLLCSGHGHNRIEYRFKWDSATNKLLTFTDHYLANPDAYYRSYLVQGDWWKEASHKRYLVRIEANAPADGTVVEIHEGGGTIWPDLSELHVPPYPTPLATATDPAAWWQAHAPVVVQTAALGPCTNTRPTLKVNSLPPGPNFQGFRIIQIAANVIARVQFVSMTELRAAASYPLPWEPAPGAGPVTPPTFDPRRAREALEGAVGRHRRQP